MIKDFNEFVNESMTPKYKEENGTYYVDSDFVNMSKKYGKLKHIFMGEFELETDYGTIKFNKSSKDIKGFTGKTHKVDGDDKVIKKLISKIT